VNFGRELNGGSRVAHRLLGCIALLVAFLFVLDFSGATGSFWQQHPVTTSLLTGAILSLGLAVGFEHVLARREELSRRPLGQAACRGLKGAMWAEETLDAYVLDYCVRTYGRPEVPVGKSYPDEIVPEALSEEETWAGADGAPDLLDAITQDQRTLQEEFARWAPILVAAPELSDAADCAAEVMRATSCIAVALAPPLFVFLYFAGRRGDFR
jgi:hypothetical protein